MLLYLASHSLWRRKADNPGWHTQWSDCTIFYTFALLSFAILNANLFYRTRGHNGASGETEVLTTSSCLSAETTTLSRTPHFGYCTPTVLSPYAWRRRRSFTAADWQKTVSRTDCDFVQYQSKWNNEKNNNDFISVISQSLVIMLLPQTNRQHIDQPLTFILLLASLGTKNPGRVLQARIILRKCRVKSFRENLRMAEEYKQTTLWA